MKKVRTFLHIFQNSFFPNIEYYPKLIKTKWQYSMKYFITLIFCLNSILFLILVLNIVLRAGLSSTKEALKDTINSYPPDLTISINDDRLISNYDRPYFMYYKHDDVPQVLLVVDEFASPEKINQYKAWVLLTKTGISIKNNDGYRFYRFNNKNPILINKTLLNKIGSIVTILFRLLPLVVMLAGLLIIPLVSAVMIVSKFIYLTLISCLIFIATRLVNKKITFQKTLQISLHAVTAVLVIELFVSILGLQVRLPLLFFLLTTLFVAGSVYETYFGIHTAKKKLLNNIL